MEHSAAHMAVASEERRKWKVIVSGVTAKEAMMKKQQSKSSSQGLFTLEYRMISFT